MQNMKILMKTITSLLLVMVRRHQFLWTRAPAPAPPATPTKTGRPAPVFRITSPSYQAVQYELQQFLQLKSSWERDQLQLEQ